MDKKFLFGDLSGVDTRASRTIRELLSRLQAGEIDLADIAHGVLEIAVMALLSLGDEELPCYVVKGRGADFLAVQLLLDRASDDMLRLHLFPRTAVDTEMHRHSRQVISSIMRGRVCNMAAFVEFGGFEDRQLDVWDCEITAGGVCVPKLNQTVGAYLRPDKSEVLAAGSTYEVPVDQYHRITAPAGTMTMCWFSKTRTASSELAEGRVIKPKGSAPTEVAPLSAADLIDVRNLLGGFCK